MLHDAHDNYSPPQQSREQWCNTDIHPPLPSSSTVAFTVLGLELTRSNRVCRRVSGPAAAQYMNTSTTIIMHVFYLPYPRDTPHTYASSLPVIPSRPSEPHLHNIIKQYGDLMVIKHQVRLRVEVTKSNRRRRRVSDSESPFPPVPEAAPRHIFNEERNYVPAFVTIATPQAPFELKQITSSQERLPRYGRPSLLESTVVPGAGLFVALGISTCTSREANVRRNFEVKVTVVLFFVVRASLVSVYHRDSVRNLRLDRLLDSEAFASRTALSLTHPTDGKAAHASKLCRSVAQTRYETFDALR
ncbi:hypothetical protein C8Q74DRAFT_1222549 [Fomes fomentarius]|nr:hypothetical protein C8Q74DRAFT_1222549 [Fomes fomentarius]